MICNKNCIHYPVCELKKYDFANIDECMYYAEERPKGKWIKESDCEDKTSTYTCSCCGFDDGWYEYRYCPECGAVIQGVKEADND